MYQAFLIKYAEIAIKGKNRYVFEDALVANIVRRLKKVDGVFTVRKESGRVYVEAAGDYDYDGTVDALQKIFGIVGICPVLLVEDQGFAQLAEDVNAHIRDTYGNRAFTFKVETRRVNKAYPMESMEVNAALGDTILAAFPQLSVDVHKPEVMIHVEIRDQIGIYSQILPGEGGLPLGTGGKAMLLLSGGIDSPVAGYMIAKRGVTIEAVYFHAPPYTSERAKQKVIDLARIVSAYSGRIKLHVVNFTDIQLAIYETCPHDELTIIMRRYMMRIAQQLALPDDCLGLVTGESIGQVASQTMQSLVATNEVCTLPVYRPLVAFDKRDIVRVAERIDTFETSILPYEDCCTIFVAKHPVTKPHLDKIHKSEALLAGKIEPLVQTALDTTEVIYVDEDGYHSAGMQKKVPAK